MSYIEKHLLRDEEVVLVAGVSNGIFFWPGLCWVLGFSFINVPAGIVFITIGLLWTILALYIRLTAELALTNQRVVIALGAIIRNVYEMRRSQIESVQVDYSLIGKIFGYAKMTIRGTGGNRLIFKKLDGADDVRKALG